jgi:anthranilate synthase component 2
MPAKVLVIDNYDSFTYNLVQYLGELKADVTVIRNDEMSLAELETMIESQGISHLLISPGPGKPADSKLSIESIRNLAGKLPILGVCLGHQAIGEVFGAKDIPEGFTATRYHSLIIDKESMRGTPLKILAMTEDALVMAITHQDYKNLLGVQYHPESILSEYGHKLLANFLAI